MSIALDRMPTWDHETGRIQVVVEAPRGSRNKYKFDPACGQMRLDKVLPLGASFPFDYGFIPSTRGEDGDPLDALVLIDEPAFPGCIVTARLVGVIEAEQTECGNSACSCDYPALRCGSWANRDMGAPRVFSISSHDALRIREANQKIST